ELNDSEARTHLADIEEVSETSQSDHLYEIIGPQDATLHQIDIALEKIEAGSYGYCEECSQPIPRARLEALPFASYCVPCQRQQELEAQLSAEQEGSRSGGARIDGRRGDGLGPRRRSSLGRGANVALRGPRGADRHREEELVRPERLDPLNDSRGHDERVPGADVGNLVPDVHAPSAAKDRVDLGAPLEPVRQGGLPRLDPRVGERVRKIGRVALGMEHLAETAAVVRDDLFQLVESLDQHRRVFSPRRWWK